ncbi:AraC family transcriptional regulator [Brotaphodocola sp.]|uniref:AraC family transcriptional regulator n=1 Tax=Brotaphodocola sp. TaxID=3073577 RepID=UPI003D7E79DA
MNQANYEMDLLRENIHLRCFAHSIMNYRYHWHPDEYELSIALQGTQEYCRGTETHVLEEDDLILTAPGNGHASMRRQAGTRALVLHFSANALKLLVKKGYIYQFPSCLSSAETRQEKRFCQIRFYASQIWNALESGESGGLYAQLSAKANLELLLITLFTEFDPQQFNLISEDDKRRASMRLLLNYVEEHYTEKLTLENLADYAQYNRTYVSTLFKQMVGINFHEYLTRVRFQHALNDLTYTKENLTDIALKNGFPDLKTLTARFRSTLLRTPAEFRASLNPDDLFYEKQRRFLTPEDVVLRRKLEEYTRIGGIA